MKITPRGAPPTVAIVGGGLAGLAAAAALAEAGLNIELFESRRRLGGRAGSFRDPATGEYIDHCQHVSMGCCTNLAAFCRRSGIEGFFRRDRRLHFFGPDGRRCDFSASAWLPPPSHLAPGLWNLTYLTRRERAGIARALSRLAREADRDDPGGPTIGDWLRDHGQTAAAIELFWTPVLVSALGESLDRAGVRYARKVFVDGFMANRHGWEVEVPQAELGVIYGERLAAWLTARRVRIHMEASVRQVAGNAAGARGIILADDEERSFDFVVVAVPWRRCGELFNAELRSALPALEALMQIDGAPISGLHLWFDRAITPLPHAVLVGRLAQWVFNRSSEERAETKGLHVAPGRHYYQVVISASRELIGRDRGQTVETVRRELCEVFPDARDAVLLDWRLVTEQAAVFSVRPGIDRLRPPQRTSVANLMLAGDWTATGWPATMEGAVRSGHLAAEAVLESLGRPTRLLAPDLPRSGWTRLLIGNRGAPQAAIR